MNLNKLYTTKKSNYTRPSFIKIFACLFVGSAVVSGVWDSATGKTDNQAQTVQTVNSSTKEAEKSSESTSATTKTEESSKPEESTQESTKVDETTQESTQVDEKPKTIKMNGSRNKVLELVDQLNAHTINFENETDRMSSDTADLDTLQGSANILQGILDDLNAIDPVSLLKGGDFKNADDYDTVILYIQTPIGRLVRNVQATLDLTNAYIDGTADQATLDTFTSLTKDAQSIPSDIEALRGLAQNDDIWAN